MKSYKRVICMLLTVAMLMSVMTVPSVATGSGTLADPYTTAADYSGLDWMDGAAASLFAPIQVPIENNNFLDTTNGQLVQWRWGNDGSGDPLREGNHARVLTTTNSGTAVDVVYCDFTVNLQNFSAATFSLAAQLRGFNTWSSGAPYNFTILAIDKDGVFQLVASKTVTAQGEEAPQGDVNYYLVEADLTSLLSDLNDETVIRVIVNTTTANIFSPGVELANIKLSGTGGAEQTFTERGANAVSGYMKYEDLDDIMVDLEGDPNAPNSPGIDPNVDVTAYGYDRWNFLHGVNSDLYNALRKPVPPEVWGDGGYSVQWRSNAQGGPDNENTHTPIVWVSNNSDTTPIKGAPYLEFSLDLRTLDNPSFSFEFDPQNRTPQNTGGMRAMTVIVDDGTKIWVLDSDQYAGTNNTYEPAAKTEIDLTPWKGYMINLTILINDVAPQWHSNGAARLRWLRLNNGATIIKDTNWTKPEHWGSGPQTDPNGLKWGHVLFEDLAALKHELESGAKPGDDPGINTGTFPYQGMAWLHGVGSTRLGDIVTDGDYPGGPNIVEWRDRINFNNSDEDTKQYAIFSDFAFDLRGLTDPRYNLDIGTWDTSDGFNVTFLVNDGEKFWVVDSFTFENRLHDDNLTDGTQLGPKNFNIDLSPWEGMEITVRVLYDFTRGKWPAFCIFPKDISNKVIHSNGEIAAKRQNEPIGYILNTDLAILKAELEAAAVDPNAPNYSGPDPTINTSGFTYTRYNWMSGMESAPFNAIKIPYVGNTGLGIEVSWRNNDGGDMWTPVIWTSNNGGPSRAAAAIDFNLNLDGLDDPNFQFTFDATNTLNYDRAVTVIVDDGQKIWVMYSKAFASEEVGEVNVNLTHWKDSKILLTVLIHDVNPNSWHNNAASRLRHIQLRDGTTTVKDTVVASAPNAWGTSGGADRYPMDNSGYILFESLNLLNTHRDPPLTNFVNHTRVYDLLYNKGNITPYVTPITESNGYLEYRPESNARWSWINANTHGASAKVDIGRNGDAQAGLVFGDVTMTLPSTGSGDFTFSFETQVMINRWSVNNAAGIGVTVFRVMPDGSLDRLRMNPGAGTAYYGQKLEPLTEANRLDFWRVQAALPASLAGQQVTLRIVLDNNNGAWGQHDNTLEFFRLNRTGMTTQSFADGWTGSAGYIKNIDMSAITGRDLANNTPSNNAWTQPVYSNLKWIADNDITVGEFDNNTTWYVIGQPGSDRGNSDWTWMEAATDVSANVLAGPNGGSAGVVFHDFPLTLPSGTGINFSFNVRLTNSVAGREDFDGLGISMFVIEDIDNPSSTFTLVRGTRVHPKARPRTSTPIIQPDNSVSMEEAQEQMYRVDADLTAYAGKTITLRVMADPANNTWADDAVFSHFALKTGGVTGTTVQTYADWKEKPGFKWGYISFFLLDALDLAINAPGWERIMEPHLTGYDPDKHLYSAIEERRPLIGAYTWSPGLSDAQMSGLSDFLDYGQENIGSLGFKRYEMGGIPWIGVYQPAIPLATNDPKWAGLWNGIPPRSEALRDAYNLMLGVTMGSEPHTSPGDYYTGHTVEEARELGTLDCAYNSNVDFGHFMKAMYNNAATPRDPDAQNNTFRGDFETFYNATEDGKTINWNTVTWDELFIPRPTNTSGVVDWSQVYFNNEDRSTWPEFPRYNPNHWLYGHLHSMFSQHAIEMAIAGKDDIFNSSNPHIPHSGRLIAWQHTPEWNLNLRQFQNLSTNIGATYYTTGFDTHFGGTDATQRAYMPFWTEWRGSFLYNQSLRGMTLHGAPNPLPIVYNEFCVNQGSDANGGINSIGNFYRGFFGEIQYKPAAITWFIHGGDGSVSGGDVPFRAEALTPHESWLAALRGQMEVGDIYNNHGGVQRPRSKLGIFITETNYYPMGLEYSEEWDRLQLTLSPQVMTHSPDIMLTNQLPEKASDYENIIILLQQIDGKTDTFLHTYLKNIPDSQNVMIVPTSRSIYTEPGGRTSTDFYRALQEVLPISPNGSHTLANYTRTGRGGATSNNFSHNLPPLTNHDININGTAVTLSAPPTSDIYTNSTMSAGGTFIGGNLAWLSPKGNYLVLAGVPVSGFAGLVNSFFNLDAPAVREAGAMMVLNVDTTEHTATKAGWYSVFNNQLLKPGSCFVGYDLTRRAPVPAGGANGNEHGGTVVRVVPETGLAVLCAGTANVELVSYNNNSAVINSKKSVYPWKNPDKGHGAIVDKITFYSSAAPTVTADSGSGSPTPVSLTSIGNGFYSFNITNENWITYSFSADISTTPLEITRVKITRE